MHHSISSSQNLDRDHAQLQRGQGNVVFILGSHVPQQNLVVLTKRTDGGIMRLGSHQESCPPLQLITHILWRQPHRSSPRHLFACTVLSARHPNLASTPLLQRISILPPRPLERHYFLSETLLSTTTTSTQYGFGPPPSR